MDLKKEELYNKAVKNWGIEAQLIMAFEELGELQQAISKHWRGKNLPKDVAQEMADVIIMMEQIQIIFGIGNEMIDYYKRLKII